MFPSFFQYATRRPDPSLPPRPRRTRPLDDGGPLTIRLAADGERALDRLAALDERTLPPGPRLVAEVAGRPVAALALSTGDAVADPFHPSAALVELLRVRADQIRVAG